MGSQSPNFRLAEADISAARVHAKRARSARSLPRLGDYAAVADGTTDGSCSKGAGVAKIAMPAHLCPHHFSRLQAVAKLSDGELEALVEQATVDAYDEYEQLASFHVMIEERLGVPFRTTVLGVEVTVRKIDLLSGTGIAAICSRGKYRQAIGILDLPLPTPPPAGAEWIDAYRRWAT